MASETTEQEEMPMTAVLPSALEDDQEEELANKHPGPLTLKVERPVYSQNCFDEGNASQNRYKKSLCDRLHDVREKNACSASCVGLKFAKYFPFLRMLRGYNIKRDLLNDVVSGITVGVMHIPQGMAYGMLANLPPVYGLYVSFFPVIIYFFLGTSKHISKGTFAVVSLMVGSVVDRGMCGSVSSNTTQSITYDVLNGSSDATAVSIDTPNTGMSGEELACRVGIATATTFLVGIIQFVMGVFKVGFVSVYLSDPLTRGFTTAAAVHVFTSQIKHVFGIRVTRITGPLNIIYTYIDFFSKITTTNIATLVMAVICMTVIYLVKEFVNPKVKAKIRMPVPIELLIVICATIVSHFAKFEERFDMIVVGDIPTGIPAPSVPPVSRFSDVIADAIGISLVAFAVDLAMAKLLANKHDYYVEANQELRAYGITNMVCSCFNCFVSVASLSRSLIQDAVGGVTQVAGLVSCCLLALVLFLVGPLFEQLPNNVLASIVIVNLKGMFLQLKDLKTLWKVSKTDFMIWIVIFVCTVIINVDLGLFIGVGFSLLTVVFRTQSPYTSILGRVEHTDIYKDIMVYSKVKEIPGIKIFRFENALYFANCEHFVKKLYKKTVNPRMLKSVSFAKKGAENNVQDAVETAVPSGGIPSVIIIDCSAISYVDYPGVVALKKVMTEFKEAEITVMLASCKAGVREMLFASAEGEITGDQLYLTVHDAVVAAFHTEPKMQKWASIGSLASIHLNLEDENTTLTCSNHKNAEDDRTSLSYINLNTHDTSL